MIHEGNKVQISVYLPVDVYSFLCIEKGGSKLSGYICNLLTTYAEMVMDGENNKGVKENT